ncbi:hypothetical protein SD81_001930 [Tolypothrix campylonemoides VB511288]|nr:hypothetical protein SD81_001930 [Tolypothrix campylonemoides VB511288]
MKRKISLVIALVLSFLMMFGSIAQAQGTKVQITVPISESADIEVVNVPVAETNQADSPAPQIAGSPAPQIKVKVEVLEGKEQIKRKLCGSPDCALDYYKVPREPGAGYWCLPC